MATTGRKQVAPGGLIQSSVWGNPVWDQSVQCFNSAADRTAQYPAASVHAGAVTWRDDDKVLEYAPAAADSWNGIMQVVKPAADGSALGVRIHSGVVYTTTNQFGQFSFTTPLVKLYALSMTHVRGDTNNNAIRVFELYRAAGTAGTPIDTGGNVIAVLRDVITGNALTNTTFQATFITTGI